MIAVKKCLSYRGNLAQMQMDSESVLNGLDGEKKREKRVRARWMKVQKTPRREHMLLSDSFDFEVKDEVFTHESRVSIHEDNTSCHVSNDVIVVVE